jgi:hypothetical protein
VFAGLVGLFVPFGAAAGPAQIASTAQSGPAASSGDVDTLRERAAAFWAARVARDPQIQWELLEPRGRGRTAPEDFAGQGGGYLAYQVEGATVNGYFATVKVRVLVQLVLPSGGPPRLVSSVLDDRWIRVGGVWYRAFDDSPQGAER